MLYDYIAAIGKQEMFYYLLILIAAMVLSTRVIPLNFTLVMGIFIGLITIYYFQDKLISTANNFNRDFQVKLANIIPQPKYFHTDADIIALIDNVSDFKEYNPESWKALILSIDNVLKLHKDMENGVRECKENLDVARGFMNDAMNHMHSYIFSLPSSVVMNEKLIKNVDRLHLLLRRHIDAMARICQAQYKKEGINSRQHPFSNYGPRPIDALNFNSQFDLYY